MLKWVGIISLIVVLAKYPEAVKKGVDVGSYLAKVTWFVCEKSFHVMSGYYDSEVQPKVEDAKEVKVD